MNQSNAAIQGQINDAINALFKKLYTSIATVVQNFNILT